MMPKLVQGRRLICYVGQGRENRSDPTDQGLPGQPGFHWVADYRDIFYLGALIARRWLRRF